MLQFSYSIPEWPSYENATAEIVAIRKDADRKIVEFTVEIRNSEGEVVKSFSVVVSNYVSGKETQTVDGEEKEVDVWTNTYDDHFKNVSSEATLKQRAYELLKEKTFEGIDFSVAEDIA